MSVFVSGRGWTEITHKGGRLVAAGLHAKHRKSAGRLAKYGRERAKESRLAWTR
jgi:hypothetical protein